MFVLQVGPPLLKPPPLCLRAQVNLISGLDQALGVF